MRLAVLIPSYNHLAEVMTCLNSLRNFQHSTIMAIDRDSLSRNIHYHVQDDCSPDVNFPDCVPCEIASVSRNERNLGFAGNCNRAAATFLDEYSADVLLFCNQDIAARPDWSQGWDTALLNAFADPTVGVVGARLLFPDGRVQNAGGVFDQFGQPMHRCLGWSNPNVGMSAQAGEVEWTSGAALAIRTSLFMQLGGFDERYRMYYEDVSLCVRAREAGYRVWYEPACTLIHSVGSTGGSPHFRASALRFKQEFVDTGRIKAGTLTPTQRMW